jgi:hypothetical protein
VIPWGIVFAIASTVSLGALGYYYVYNRDVGGERARLLKERTSLAEQIAEDYGSLRGRVEPAAVALAQDPWPGDLVDPDARSATWRERPTVYLRIRKADATGNEAVHAAAKLSSLDGLSACLLRTKGAGPWSYGDVVSRAEFLTTDWIRDVKETKNDLRLRNLAYALEQYREKDWPEVRDASKLAEYAVVVLDEDPASIPAHSPTFGADASVHQRILPTEHPIRFSLRRLADGRELLRLRRTPSATLMQVAGDPTATAAGLEVRQIQAVGCSMANEALALLGQGGGPEVVATPPPLPVAPPAVAPPAVAPPAVAPPAVANAAPSAAGNPSAVPSPSAVAPQ